MCMRGFQDVVRGILDRPPKVITYSQTDWLRDLSGPSVSGNAAAGTPPSSLNWISNCIKQLGYKVIAGSFLIHEFYIYLTLRLLIVFRSLSHKDRSFCLQSVPNGHLSLCRMCKEEHFGPVIFHLILKS